MLVSVIIPVYNTAKYLARCLDSVGNQLLKDIEILCAYQESTDHSYSILQDYQKKEPRLKIIPCIGHGLSLARNQGLRHAQGEYVFFLDSDDWIANNALSDLVAVAEQDALDVVYFDSTVVFEDEIAKSTLKYKSCRTNTYASIYTGLELFDAFYKNDDHLVVSWGAIYRRKYLMQCNLLFYEGILHEDVLFYPQVLLSARRARCLNQSYYFYYRRMNSITGHGATTQNIRSMIIVYAELWNFLETSGYWHHDSVNAYLNGTVYANILGMLHTANYTADALESLVFDTPSQAMKFQFLMATFSPAHCRPMYKDEIERLKTVPHLIVYGAGVVARDVIQILLAFKVDNFHVAVTATEAAGTYIGGCPIHAIHEFAKWRENSMVLIAVSQKYQDEIVATLKELGFAHYRYMAKNGLSLA